ncbi:MAG: hypothetical protein K2X39_04060, partial [Silvanigrellaceae bacterium]|nr:hypothetical protein [Silvanigrellaceae bacterium]
ALNFNGIYYFTGAFIMHPRQVKRVIHKHVDNFLNGEYLCEANKMISWKEELATHKKLLDAVNEQKRQSQHFEKKRAVDILKVTKKMAEIPKTISSKNLVMALGRNEYVSPYISETNLYDPIFLLQKLAYCEIKSYRYRHIDPVKIYESISHEGLGNIDMPKVPLRRLASEASNLA